MNEPLLSVIVPVYNVEKYIEECLNSIINSTYKNFEVIVINDGTKDKSAEIAKKFAEKDSRIKVFDFENAGVSEARNRGLRIAKGDYISFVDSDDLIDKNMYADLIEKMQRYDLDIIKCGCFEGDTGKWNKKFSFDEEKIYEKQSIVNEVLDQYFEVDYLWGVLWNGIYKREIVMKVKFPTFLMVGEDICASAMYLGFAKKIMTVKECYYYYRKNLNSITKSEMLIKRPLDRILAAQQLISDLKKMGISNKKFDQEMALRLYYFCRAKNNKYYRLKKINRSLYEYIMENLANWRKKIRFFITCHRKNLL